MDVQEKALIRLIKKAKETAFGDRFGFETIRNYADFAERVPTQSYESLQPYIDRCKSGESDVLWPGKIRHFSVSSGTTGAGKHIPITEQRFNSDKKYRQQVVFRSLFRKRGMGVLFGKMISLPGSLETIHQKEHSFKIGEISALSATQIPDWINRFQILSPKKAVLMDLNDKFEYLMNHSLREDIRCIAGAPTWIIKILEEAEIRTKKPIFELWPHLNLIISGGVALRHYIESIKKRIYPLKTDFLEMYGASEGYLGLSRINQISRFDLLLNNGMFYEFEDVENGQISPYSAIKTGKSYSIFITTDTGLWRYPLKDIVQKTEEGKILIKGRLNSMLDYFGEALMLSEVQSALKQCKIDFERLILAPYQKENERKILVFIDTDKQTITDEITSKFDKLLQVMNRHYAIRRETATLSSPEIRIWTKKLEKRYLDQNGKKAQSKIPEILTQPFDIEE